MNILIFFISFITAFVALRLLIPRLKQAGIVGQDMNKPGKPEVAEMGGLGIIAGFVSGVILAIALKTFTGALGTTAVNVEELFAALAVILLIGLIGIVDDLVHMPKGIKTLMPVFAALPLSAIQVGDTTMRLPFIGWVDFKIIYPLVLVPLGVTGAANAVNLLAGFNGLEVGMGLVAVSSLAIIAYTLEEMTAFIILIAAIGALLAALRFNWYPARVFIGDVGTLSIGAIIASSVILGNFETAGVIIIIPYFVDFIIKAMNGLPSKGWWGEYNDGRLHCPKSGPVGLCQLIMKFIGGISERGLVLTLIGVEAALGLIAILMYAKL